LAREQKSSEQDDRYRDGADRSQLHDEIPREVAANLTQEEL
jgi:hypothetical protein